MDVVPMKAIVNVTYGSPDVLKLTEVETPSPMPNEVLVKVCAAAVNAYDWHMLRADPFFVRFFAGFFRPKRTILGADVAGIVESVGAEVTRFKPGDEVYADTSSGRSGSFAEYVCVREHLTALKPANLSFEQAASVPLAAVTALQGLRDWGRIEKGQKVLINGASGGVGTFAVQIAGVFGAEVVAVCSTRNVETVKTLGATRVIDYTRDDFTRGHERYDLIYAANGNRSLFDYTRVLAPGGSFVLSGGSMPQLYKFMMTKPLVSLTRKVRMVNFVAQPKSEDLDTVRELIESGKVRPIIDRQFALAGVPDAIRYVEEGHARGKVVITV